MVLNGMNELFIEILKANDFLVIKRKIRVLSKAEASYLCKMERVTESNIQLYIDYIMSGPSEIVVVSKLGAVADARSICHGSETGRRRLALVDDDKNTQRDNVDSLNAMFEVAPFSSFNELIDLHDFYAQHSRYQKLSKNKDLLDEKALKALEVLKIEEIKLELNTFQRMFSLAAFAAPGEAES